jgi:hypothetical protein
MIRFKNLIEVPQNLKLLQSQTATLVTPRTHASATPKLRLFVAINHVVIKMLDASISISADVMEGERLCTLMGRWERERSPKLSNARRPMPEAKKWPTLAN